MERLKKEAVKLQREFSDVYSRSVSMHCNDERDHIKFFIGFEFFGLANGVKDIVESLDNDEDFTGRLYDCYTEEQKTVIESAYNIILQSRRSTRDRIVKLRNTYLLIILDKKGNVSETNKNLEDSLGVYKLLAFSFAGDGPEDYSFIDIVPRYYENWENFIKNNLLDSCQYCTPKDGFYFPGCVVSFLNSPASKFSNHVLKVADVVTSVGGVAAGIAAMVGTAPVVLPVALGTGATAAVYCVGRSVAQLWDRSAHKQSINVTNKEATSCWMTIGTGALSAVSLGTLALCRLPLLTEQFGTTAINGIKVLTWSTVGVDATCVFFNAYCVWDKYRKVNRVDPIDIVRMCAQILFLTGSVISVRQLHLQLSEMQLSVPQKLVNSVKRNLSGETSTRSLFTEVFNICTDNVRGSEVDILSHIIAQCPNILPHLFINSNFNLEFIVYNFKAVCRAFARYSRDEIKEVDFFVISAKHLYNLFLIVKKDIEPIKESLSKFFRKRLMYSDIGNTSVIISVAAERIKNTEAMIVKDLIGQESTNDDEYVVIGDGFAENTISAPPAARSYVTNVDFWDVAGNLQLLFIQVQTLFGEVTPFLALYDSDSIIKAFEKLMNSVIDDVIMYMHEISAKYETAYRKNQRLFGPAIVARTQKREEVASRIFLKAVDKAITHCKSGKLYKILDVDIISCSDDAVTDLEPVTNVLSSLSQLILSAYSDTEVTSYEEPLKVFKNMWISGIEILLTYNRINPDLTYHDIIQHMRKPNMFIAMDISFVSLESPSDVSREGQCSSRDTPCSSRDTPCSSRDTPCSSRDTPCNYRSKASCAELFNLNMFNCVSQDGTSEDARKLKLLEAVGLLIAKGEEQCILYIYDDNAVETVQLLITFVKNKVIEMINEMKNNEPYLRSVVEKENGIFERAIKNFMQLCEYNANSILLEFAEYCTFGRLDMNNEMHLWEDLANYNGIECYRYFNCIDLDSSASRTEIEDQFEVNLNIDDIVIKSKCDGNVSYITPKLLNTTFKLIVCFAKYQEGGTVLCYK